MCRGRGRCPRCPYSRPLTPPTVCLSYRWLNRFFQYLNRYFVQHHNLPTLVEAGLSEFCTVLFTPIKVDLANAMLDLINKERDGDMVDRGTLRKCVEVFEAMGDGNLDVYRDDFQSLLLGSTKEYYARKAQAWIESDPTPVYAVKVHGCWRCVFCVLRCAVCVVIHPPRWFHTVHTLVCTRTG